MPQRFLKDIDGRTILYVMAADAEYGEHLCKRIRPVFTGVGPVESAIAVTRALTTLDAVNRLPTAVVSLGSAGSNRLEQGKVFQVSQVSYRDMDASPLGFEKGATPFLDLPAIVELPVMIPEIETATLSTGANIVSGNAYHSIDADLVDMETFAVLRACQMFDVPLIGLRGVSDGATELKHIGDWTDYLHVVDENLGHAVDGVEEFVRTWTK